MKLACRNLAAVALLIVWMPTGTAHAQTQATAGDGYTLHRDIAYRPDHPEPYARERCKLDVYAPDVGHADDANAGFTTVVWFHAGGLKSGRRSVPESLKNQGLAVVAVDYRLHPRVTAPGYLEDAAAAVAWTLDHIAEYGGDPDRVVLSGHSAGGYLVLMIGLDPSWLDAHGHDADRLAGIVELSGHAVTHFTVRAERGIPGEQPIVDELAPLFHVRGDGPPLVLVTGDRELEMLGRYEETAYLWRMLKVCGDDDAALHELEGFTHGGMVKPGLLLVRDFVKRLDRRRREQATPTP
ncbi:MAG: alpha/beta hydrolase [Planctomycetota bacterium]